MFFSIESGAELFCHLSETLILQFMHDGEESSGDESDYTSRTLNYELDSVDSDCETRDTSPEAVP